MNHGDGGDPQGRVEVQHLVDALTGPIAAMMTTLGQGVTALFDRMVDQAYESGRRRGWSEAEHRVAARVGTTTAQGGVLGRCPTCGGDGLVTTPPPVVSPVGTLRASAAETAVLPRIVGEADTAQYRIDQFRRNPPR